MNNNLLTVKINFLTINLILLMQISKMAAAEVLLKTEPAPQSIAVDALGKKEHFIPINTGSYTSHGLATAGFRSSKYTPDEWHQNNYSKFYQSFSDRDNAERIQHESKKLANETLAITNRWISFIFDNWLCHWKNENKSQGTNIFSTITYYCNIGILNLRKHETSIL